ncbi:hypothetical protein [Vibrio phage phiKT1024]|nr:hypothetical protein [Vibrio phage phiKT1024]
MQKYHYVYRITNIIKNKHYYGTRTSNGLPREDLGIKYFSSSKDKEFIEDQKLFPDDYKYKIIKILKTRQEAIELEIKLHNKFDVGVNESFYNRAKQTSTRWDTTGIPSKPLRGELNGMYGKKHSEDAILKIREARKRQGSNVWNKGKHLDDDYKRRISSTVSEQRWIHKDGVRLKIHFSELDGYISKGWKQGLIKDDLERCPHCGKIANRGNIRRWHLEKCKFKSDPAPIDVA